MLDFPRSGSSGPFRTFLMATLAAFAANAETIKVADCERDPKLDFWATADKDFCVAVMDDVFLLCNKVIQSALRKVGT